MGPVVGSGGFLSRQARGQAGIDEEGRGQGQQNHGQRHIKSSRRARDCDARKDVVEEDVRGQHTRRHPTQLAQVGIRCAPADEQQRLDFGDPEQLQAGFREAVGDGGENQRCAQRTAKQETQPASHPRGSKGKRQVNDARR